MKPIPKTISLQVVTDIEIELHGETPESITEQFRGISIDPKVFLPYTEANKGNAKVLSIDAKLQKLPHLVLEPLKDEEINDLVDEIGYLDVIVPMTFDELVGDDPFKKGIERINDIVETKILGQVGVLQDISYRIVGLTDLKPSVADDLPDGTVLLYVTGQPIINL